MFYRHFPSSATKDLSYLLLLYHDESYNLLFSYINSVFVFLFLDNLENELTQKIEDKKYNGNNIASF